MSESVTPAYDQEPLEKADRRRKRAGDALGHGAGFMVGFLGVGGLAVAWLSSCSPSIESESPPGSFAEDFSDDKLEDDTFVIDYDAGSDYANQARAR